MPAKNSKEYFSFLTYLWMTFPATRPDKATPPKLKFEFV